MSNSPSLFVTIGSKGTSLPHKLKELTPPLKIGANGIAENGINWSKDPYKQLGQDANGWVSKARKGDPFFLYRLCEAIRDGRVIHIPRIAWISGKQRFIGDAFFPQGWKPGDKQPHCVAVRAPGWNHGCLEIEYNKSNKGKWVGMFDLNSTNPAPRWSMSDPVDIEAEIEAHRDSFAHEPETTMKAIIDARRGQGLFRRDLKKLWQNQCAVTTCDITAVLEASHIKPWCKANNKERLNRFNGLLLVPNLHAAFDLGLISFQNDGGILLSPCLSETNTQILGIHSSMRLYRVFPENEEYLSYHRHRHGFTP